MNTSARRGISYPQADRSDTPDVPAHIGNLVTALELDVIFKQNTNAARLAATHMTGVLWYETDTGAFYYDNGTTWVSLGGSIMGSNVASAATIATSAPSHKITGSTTIDTINDSLAYAGKSLKLVFQATISVRHNVGNIKLQGGIHAGFVANEVLTLIYDGTNWIEDSRSAKHLTGEGGIIINGSGTPTGLVSEDGSAISRTTFVAAFLNIGTLYGAGDGSTTFNIADSRGRADIGFVPSGGHVDVSTIGLTEGVALASRRPKHSHPTLTNPAISAPTITVTANSDGGNGGGSSSLMQALTGGARILIQTTNTPISAVASTPVASGMTVGPQTTAPGDSPAYLVRPKYTRL